MKVDMSAKHHLNTLFVTTEDTYLAKEGEAVVVKQGDASPLRVPIHMLESITFLAPATLSPHLMALCAERAVSVSFLAPNGRFLARVEGRISGNVLLRKAQFRASDLTSAALEYARVFVQAKIHNCRTLLLRAAREHGDSSRSVELTATALRRCLRQAKVTADMNQLRGIEGEAARHYFTAFPDLVRVQDPDIRMVGRTRRPPKDPVNALLSFAYAMLSLDTRSACESVGLDPQVGFLHADRPGRVGLALDLAEEFRAVIADRVVLSVLNRQQVARDGFVFEEGGGVRLTDAARRTFLVEYQRRKQEEIKHPFLNERMTLGLAPLLQARLLARALRGDTDGYPPFLWR